MYLPPARGFTLVELLLVLVLSVFLMAGLVQIVSAASSSFRLQENQAEVMENARHLMSTIGAMVRQSGFSPEPWNEEYPRLGLMEETADQVTSKTDRLVLRYWSDTNCFDNRNPVVDEVGQPEFFIRESLLDLNSRSDLTHTCRYGPDDSALVTQINHQGFIQNVESFQLLYGEDTSGDGTVNHWAKGGQWASADGVLAVRIGFLLRSTDAVVEATPQTYSILDQPYTASADGRLRQMFVFTTVIRGNSQ